MHRTALALVLLVLAGCDRKSEDSTSTSTPPSTSTSTPPSAAAPNMPPLPHGHGMMAPPGDDTPAAISWADPPSWKRNPPANGMRKAEYVIPHTGKDTENGECVVFNFGAGQGGAVQANIDRWKQQMTPAPGGEPKTTTSTVSGMNVTTLEMTGTLKPSSMMGAPGPAKPGQRMIGAVVEAPGGPWFFKVTGPDATVKDAAPAFRTMIESVKKTGS
jgi:hypothetical protein